jgi:hypothetical protein
MIRRAVTSGRLAAASPEFCNEIHSSTSARALARVIPESAARKWRSQLNPCSATDQSSDGAFTSNGERASHTTTLPPNENRPA